MARLTWCTIEGYKSIRDQIRIEFPENGPLVLIGENNAGKSNIVSALDVILGETWPGSKEPEDHDYWKRDSQTGCIQIEVGLTGVHHPRTDEPVSSLVWKCEPNSEEKPLFRVHLDNGDMRYVSNELRNQLMLITIGADRRLSYQLSYTSKYTFLSKLMRKFHAVLTSDSDRVNRLKAAFRDLEAIFHEVEEFARFEEGLAQQFGEMFAGMSYGLHVDFSAYDPSRFFHSLRVVPKEGDERRTFDELGTGQEQILALAFAHAYARAFYGGIILVIEEPEAHLHPLAQRWLAQQIKRMCADGLQVILTTHSPAFIDILNLEGLVLVRKDENGATHVHQLTREKLTHYCIEHGANSSKTSADTILPFYATHATEEILSGFFAKAVVLVEGQTEALALPVYLRRVGLDVTREGIAIIPVMGKGNLAKWWRLFTAYGITVYITFDNDTSDDPNGVHRSDALKTIGVGIREIEEATGTSEWFIRDRYCVFGGDFERCMRSIFGNQYEELEDEAREKFGNSKPIVARHVAEELSGSEEGWDKVEELKKKIRSLVTGRTAAMLNQIQQQDDQEQEFLDSWKEDYELPF
ncbi:MAG: AAA family ATPase [Chloroflexi bacterium]|nr:AAA family ATPase [Chloroflexota bacterium]